MHNSIAKSFHSDGFAVARAVFGGTNLFNIREAWKAFSAKQREVLWNPVEVVGPFPHGLEKMYRHEYLLDLVESLIGENIALYNFRFIVKDIDSRGPVFLHQDSGYHVGFLSKLSAFVALSHVNRANGGLGLYPTTHRLGYLGDTGEINTGLVDIEPVFPELEPGDVVFMNSLTWHESGPNTTSDDRVMADIIMQPTTDPSGIALLRGRWRCEPRAFLRRGDAVFKWSRASRLREVSEKLKRYE